MDRYIAPAISAFTTSMWIILEVEQCREQLPRNLETLDRGKISPAGRNDTSVFVIPHLAVI